MDINLFVNITSKAWALPILASLHTGTPGRQAPLLAATGAGRTAFSQSMTHLIELGLLERNPGHGHPLRPEFRLTPKGEEVAGLAHRIQSLSQEKDRDLLRRSWTLPILSSLQKPSYFNDIRRRLTPITDRALSQNLKLMEGRNWVERKIDDTARPPRALYRSVNLGLHISRITGPQIRLP